MSEKDSTPVSKYHNRIESDQRVLRSSDSTHSLEYKLAASCASKLCCKRAVSPSWEVTVCSLSLRGEEVSDITGTNSRVSMSGSAGISDVVHAESKDSRLERLASQAKDSCLSLFLFGGGASLGTH